MIDLLNREYISVRFYYVYLEAYHPFGVIRFWFNKTLLGFSKTSKFVNANEPLFWRDRLICKRDDGAEGRKLRRHCKVKTSYFIRSVNRLLSTNLINPKDRITA